MVPAKQPEHQQKIERYYDLITKLENLPLTKSRWVDCLLPILDQGTQICKGEVFYSIHMIVDEKVRFETGGPSYLLPLREDTKEASIHEGCIGATIRDHQAFRIWNDVETNYKDIFLRRYKRTKSELVIIIPGVGGSEPLGVINLESDAPDAFDIVDGLAFSAIACWAAGSVQNENHLRANRRLLETIGQAVEAALISQARDRKIFQGVADAVRTLIAFDAIAIFRYAPLEPVVDTGAFRAPLVFEYLEGHEERYLNQDEFRCDSNSFTVHVMASNQTQVVNLESGDHYRLRKYRPRTSYAIGVPVLSNRRLGPEGALILEFDKMPLRPDTDRGIAEALAPLVGALMRQYEFARERASLQRTLEALPMMANIVTPAGGLTELLENAAKQIARSLRASGCGFYEVLENDAAGALSQLAWWGETESNAFWLKNLCNLWEQKIRRKIEENVDADFGEKLEPSVEGGERFYRIFAQSIRLIRPRKKVLFVSFKAAGEARYESLHLSEISRAILCDELAIIERMVEQKKMEEQRNALREGFVKAVRLWMGKCVEESAEMTPDEQEDHLFRSVHEFLKAWRPLDTPFSAIFLIDSSQATLSISRATEEHLRAILRANGGSPNTLSKFPPVDVAPGSEMENRCLTASVWRHGSRISFSVEQEGSPGCKEFWYRVSGIQPSRRYFAGVRIIHPKTGRKFGVLTVNGPKPPEFFPRRIEEAEWQLIPMLEILGQELGSQLAECRSESQTMAPPAVGRRQVRRKHA